MIILILMILMLTNDYCFLLYIILVYMIMRLFGFMVNLLLLNLLKDDPLKAIAVNPCQTFELHNPMLYLLSTTCAHSCYFNHTN
jgi:hypothetical protein